ncbi:MAG: lamin tail domain-containing protein [Myxococcaceae bacterium]|nr:lamin tail domain-containing protein [Myxococcaceae bacterium]
MFRSLSPLFGLAALSLLAGCPTPEAPTPEVPPSAQVKSFTASASSVAPGGEVTLSWETTDAKSVSLTTQSGKAFTISAADAAKGSLVVKPQENTLYILTAFGPGGSDTASAPVAVQQPNDEFFFAVFPQKVTAGEEVSIVWNIPAAESVHIEDAGGEVVYDGANHTGSLVRRPNFSTTYTLTAGDHESSIAVEVGPAILAFASAAPSVDPDGTITLNWKVGGATEVTLEGEGRGVIHTASTPEEIADGTFSEPVPELVSDLNGLVPYRLVARNGADEVSQDLIVYAGADPIITEFTTPTYAKLGGTFSVSWKTAEASSVQILVNGAEVYTTQEPGKVANGTAQVSSPVTDGDVTIVARNARGGSASRSGAVSVVGDLLNPTFTVDIPVLANGGTPAQLSWNVENARHVELYEFATGKVLEEVNGEAAETGTHTVYPNAQTTYALFAENLVGDALSPPLTVTVDVTTPAKLVFTPSPVPEGTVIQLTGSTLQGGGPMRAVNFAVKNDPAVSFIDITNSGTPVPGVVPDLDTNELFASFGTSFSTVIMGTPVTAHGVTVSADGFLLLSDALVSTSYPTTLPSTTGEPLQILAFADDLETGNDTQILWQIDGAGSQRRLIVQWNNIYEYPYTQTPTKKLTFQVQIYEDGQINVVFKDVIGYDSTDKGLIGVKNFDESGAVQVYPDQFANGIFPSPGDSFSFFGVVPTPTPVLAATGRSYTVVQEVGNGGAVEITGAPEIIPPGQFEITEVNLVPASGVTDGQWLEITNNTSDPIDLNGWSIDDGNGGGFTITSSLVMQPNSAVVLGQSANAGDNVPVDYVWGSGYQLPSTQAFDLSLTINGGVYSTFRIPGTVVPGRTIQLGAPPNDPALIKASGITRIACVAPSTATYGSPNGQLGTPGQPNPACAAYSYAGQSIPGNFESISATGTQIVPSGDSDESIDEVQLAVPIRVGGFLFDRIWVGTNGFISFKPLSCTSPTSCYPTNKTTPKPTDADSGLVAPFWDSLAAVPGGGIWWERREPGITPNDGYTIVSWEHVKYDLSSYTFDYNFQVKFFDNGDIEFHFGTMTDSVSTAYERGLYATTWLEDPTGSVAWKVNVNSSTSPGIDPNSAYRFVAQ